MSLPSSILDFYGEAPTRKQSTEACHVVRAKYEKAVLRACRKDSIKPECLTHGPLASLFLLQAGFLIMGKGSTVSVVLSQLFTAQNAETLSLAGGRITEDVRQPILIGYKATDGISGLPEGDGIFVEFLRQEVDRLLDTDLRKIPTELRRRARFIANELIGVIGSNEVGIHVPSGLTFDLSGSRRQGA